MKVLITGAHFTPAQAVIEELQKFPEVKLIYVGRKTTREGDTTSSVESQVLPKLGVKFVPITTGRLRRVLDIWTVISLLKIPVGFIQAPFILMKESPDVIVSFGGYVGVPLVIWGWFFSIPIIVHEQTLVSGLANTISNIFATKIAVSFDKDYSFKREKIILTGNPMRKELLEGSKNIPADIKKAIQSAKSEKLPLIYITGGNQGSHTINTSVADVLEELTKKAVVIHQTGDSEFKDFESLSEKKKDLKNPDRYLVKKWVDVWELSEILRVADIVVSRAGANTLGELAYFSIPTLVVPLPFSNKDEQLQNALFFKKQGLAQILEQKDLSGKKLLEKIVQMLHNIKALRKQAEKAQKVVITDASKKLTQEIVSLAQNA